MRIAPNSTVEERPMESTRKLEKALDVIENSDSEWVCFDCLQSKVDVDPSTLAAIMRELEDKHNVQRETIGYEQCGYKIEES